MAQIFEMVMMICFGLSWPINLNKSIRSRTAKGKSVMFEVFIVIGYLSGMAGKFITNNVTYVVFFYVLNTAMVTADILFTLRNKKLDRERDLEAAK